MAPHRVLIGLCIVLATSAQAWAVMKANQTVLVNTFTQVGYYLEMLKSEPIRIKQDGTSADPYHTYTGCGPVTLVTGFPCQLSVRATGTSAAGGRWTATVRPSILARGNAQVKVCVKGEGVAIDSLKAGSTVKVAQVVVTVIPTF
jgi:hypothetical protein